VNARIKPATPEAEDDYTVELCVTVRAVSFPDAAMAVIDGIDAPPPDWFITVTGPHGVTRDIPLLELLGR
jgi:hypothetical protein